jgi:hypothetical protein
LKVLPSVGLAHLLSRARLQNRSRRSLFDEPSVGVGRLELRVCIAFVSSHGGLVCHCSGVCVIVGVGSALLLYVFVQFSLKMS